MKQLITKMLTELQHQSKNAALASEHDVSSDVRHGELMQRQLRLLKTLSVGEKAVIANESLSHHAAKARMSK